MIDRTAILRRAYALAELEGTLDCWTDAIREFHAGNVRNACALSGTTERWEDAWDLAVHRPEEAA